MNTCEKIAFVRKKKNLTQKELGNKLGVTQQTVAQYENGTRMPKLETLKKIASALDVPVGDILGLDDDEYPHEIFISLPPIKNGEIVYTKEMKDEQDIRLKLLIDSGVYEAYHTYPDVFDGWSKKYRDAINRVIENCNESIQILRELDTRYIDFNKLEYINSFEEILSSLKYDEYTADDLISDLDSITQNNLDIGVDYKLKILQQKYPNKDFNNMTNDEVEVIYDFLIDDIQNK